MTNQTDLQQLIRSVMKQSSTPKPSKQTGKGVQKTKQQPRRDRNGKLGDNTRSNSNPTSRSVNNIAPVGFEDVSEAGDGSVRALIRINLASTGRAPSKRQTKHMAMPKMTRSDRVFGKGVGVGSSRSVTLGIVKAIAAKETGCIALSDKTADKLPKAMKATTSRNDGNVIGGYQIIK